MEPIDIKTLDPRFKDDVAAHPGGENIKLCFACGTCTAGCPVAAIDTDFNPRRIIRKVLLGMRKEVLSSPEIWRCIQCYSCTAKCPQNVKFREIIRALRAMAVEEGFADKSLIGKIDELNSIFLTLRNKLATDLAESRCSVDEIRKKFDV